MAGMRMSMRKIREVLRLTYELGLSVREVCEANRARRTHPRSGTPTSAGVASTTDQLPDDRVPREARKRRRAKKDAGEKKPEE